MAPSSDIITLEQLAEHNSLDSLWTETVGAVHGIHCCVDARLTRCSVQSHNL
jgi:hypothetical protein